ncbi:hypothetical protein [Schleiferilactobacillus harbinensis]|uniref:hypothetical protein n=1 Tax=Schleiferilactobacillus harbinensis TaxID=304207 RepID=UPI00116C380B|nr:hypothetical protein [Schleiferilactobacillus harbinensis]GEK06640.1 hypothetical protein LHA01_18790 [Schleiferilactobacillus harbinensis]
MLSEQTVRDILTLPQFGSQASVLSRHLKEPLADASQDLIVELLTHRLQSWTDLRVEVAIMRELPDLMWRIAYARKDIERQQWHSEKVEADKADMLGLTIPPDPHNEAEIEEAIERANSILHNSQSRAWVSCVLQHGKAETMAQFHQTNRQFQTKLRKMVNYLTEHRKDIDK